MRRNRGFRLGRKMGRVCKWLISRRAQMKATSFLQLRGSNGTGGALSKLCSWGRSLRLGANALCSAKKRPGYIRVGQEPAAAEESKNSSVNIPKGHLAVYVGEDDDDTSRVIVPVIYFNHPLFADLLREAEKVHGYDHPGGIQIPCQKSEIETVKMRIAAAGSGGRSSGGRRSWRQLLMSSRQNEYLDQ